MRNHALISLSMPEFMYKFGISRALGFRTQDAHTKPVYGERSNQFEVGRSLKFLTHIGISGYYYSLSAYYFMLFPSFDKIK